MTTTLKQVIGTIETTLAHYYRHAFNFSAADFLVSKEELLDLFGSKVEQADDWQARASVWVHQDTEKEGFIGLYFADAIAQSLNDDDPSSGITHVNLDSFCVVAEEVSHFHQLVQHLTRQTAPTKLELETQGEIDKIVSAGVLLAHRHGDAHLPALTRKVYDESTIVATNQALYWQASKLAATLWQDLLQLIPHHRNILAEREVNSHLQKIFTAKGAEKLAAINSRPKISA